MVLVFRLLRRDEGIAGGGIKIRDCTRYGIERAVSLFLRIGALFEF